MTGHDLLLYFEYQDEGSTLWLPFGCSKSHEIKGDVEEIEISSPTSGVWRQYLTGRKEWSVTCSYLVLAKEQLRDLLEIGNTFNVCFKQRNEQNSTGLSGTCFLKSVIITASEGNLVQGSFTFRGTGALI